MVCCNCYVTLVAGVAFSGRAAPVSRPELDRKPPRRPKRCTSIAVGLTGELQSPEAYRWRRRWKPWLRWPLLFVWQPLPPESTLTVPVRP